MMFLGGDSNWVSVNGGFVTRNVRRCGTGIPCLLGDDGLLWKRVLRCRDWPEGKAGGGQSRIGGGGLRTWVNHLWTEEAGDADGSEGEVSISMASDLLRLCFADFDKISPLKLSTALYLFV